MDNIRIEKLDKKDLESTASVMRSAFASVGQKWNREDSITYIQDHLEDACIYVAKENNVLVGFLVADKHTDHLFIDAIGVVPVAMGKGIAKALWNQAVEYCREKHIPQAKMIADPQSQAYQWYKRLGFEETGWVEMSLDFKK